MKRFAFLAVILFSTYALAGAQTDKKPELFAGYSFESVNSGVTSVDVLPIGVTQTSLDNRFNLNGFNVSGAAYFTRHLGIAGDFSAHFDKRTDFFDTIPSQSNFKLYNITAGPQYKFSGFSRFTPFTHALFGIAHRNLTETLSSGSDNFTDRTTSFAMNLGGGVDYELNDRFAVRLFQFDYNPIFLRSRTIDSIAFPGHTLNGVRISAGIVIK
jgi:opacity protein-like surface antigen